MTSWSGSTIPSSVKSHYWVLPERPAVDIDFKIPTSFASSQSTFWWLCPCVTYFSEFFEQESPLVTLWTDSDSVPFYFSLPSTAPVSLGSQCNYWSCTFFTVAGVLELCMHSSTILCSNSGGSSGGNLRPRPVFYIASLPTHPLRHISSHNEFLIIIY